MNSAWPLITAALLMGAGGSLHCVAMCSGLQRMTLRGIPIITRRGQPAAATQDPTTPTPTTTPPANAGAAPNPADATSIDPLTHISRHAAITAGGAAMALALDRRPATSVDGTASTHLGLRFRWPDGRWWRFQAGRITGYALLGASVGMLGQGVLNAAQWQASFESIWAGLNGLLVLLGLSLLILGREPRWLAAAGSRLAGLARTSPGSNTGWLRGMLWALLPCGLLYTALATAILAATPLASAIVMAAFALGTNLGLLLMESGLHSLLAGRRPELGYRLNGLILVGLAGAGLAAALTGHSHPFC